MVRIVVLVAVAVSTLAAVACGGGSGDRNGLITIHRIDLEDAELNPFYFLNPSPANDYPDVVAEVNGVAVTGDELASRQVALELTRRQWSGEFADNFPDEVVRQEIEKNEAADPLQELVDEELERQAVIRLGLLPTDEEAMAAAREQQRMSDEAIANAPAEQREIMLQTMDQIGAPSGDWGADSEWVERFREARGLVKLRQGQCAMKLPTPGELSYVGGYDCSAFLAQERESADIVYHVRWAG